MSADATSRRRAHACLLAGALAIACADPAPEEPNPPWRGEVVEEDGATIVRTLEGSVWPGPARLVEELRIGVGEGEEPYMLGSVVGIATHGNDIYLADSSVPVVRVYSSTGEHVLDIGRRGEGPGEFLRPLGIAIADERLFVRDYGTYRIAVFSLDGAPLDTYPIQSRYMTSAPLVVTADGIPRSPYSVDWQAGHPLGLGMIAYGPEGQVGEPLRFPFAEGELSRLIGPGPPCPSLPVPYSADHVFAMGSNGSLYAAYSGGYQIRELRPGGILRIMSREIDPVPLPDEHREYARRFEVAFNRHACGANWNWVGPDIPATKPHFDQLIPTRTGELWVVRRGESVRQSPCDDELLPSGERPGPRCWNDERIVDAFGTDGRYLGTVDLPDDVRAAFLFADAHIVGDTVYVAVTDADGVVQVRRYRLEESER